MNTDCTSTGYREPTPFYVCFIPLPPPYSSSIKRASTHATVAPPPISDHPLAFRDRFNHPPWTPPVDRARVAWWSQATWAGFDRDRRRDVESKLWRDRSRTKILAGKFCLLYTMWIRRCTVNFELRHTRWDCKFDIREKFILNSDVFKNSYFDVTLYSFSLSRNLSF